MLNGNLDAALNAAADSLGLTQPLSELHSILAGLQAANAEQRIEEMRAAMRAAGVPDVPTGYERALVECGAMVRDYGATADKLNEVYQNHLRNQRMTETWGENWRDIHIGRSQMTALEFEAKTFKVQQQAADDAYQRGLGLLATGELKVGPIGVMQTLGTYVDWQVRERLRYFGTTEGIPDSSASNVFAVNRVIRGQGLVGIPDLRVGSNLILALSLAPKDGSYEQLQRWRTAMANTTVIVRPSTMPGGGAYVVRRAAIPRLISSRKGG